MKNSKTIIFISEMPITNGVIQAQLLPIVFSSAKKGFQTYILETTGRFDSQENIRKNTEEKLKNAGVFLEKIAIPRHTFFPSILYFSAKSHPVIKKIFRNSPESQVIIYARNYKFAPVLLFSKIPFIYSPRGAYVAERKYYRKIKDILYGNLIGYFEKKAIEKSQVTVFETDDFKNHLKEIYSLKNTGLEVIPNYYDNSLVLDAQNSWEKIRKEMGYENKKVIVYAGTIEIWYDFERMFDLVSRLKKKDSRIFFQLFTKIDYARDESKGLFENLKKIAQKYSLLENSDYAVSSYPPQKRYAYLSACDAGICLTAPHKFKTMMMYLKIVDYLGAGLPIIVNSEVRSVSEIIKNSDIGAIVDYNDWESSISKIDMKTLFEKTGTGNAEYEKFSSSNIIPRYLDLFESVFKKNKKTQ